MLGNMEQLEIQDQKLKELLELARWGWWKADFHSKKYYCSEYLQKILGLSSEQLSFEDFQLMIREDYRERITQEFTLIYDQNIYEQTFPIYSSHGCQWVHSQLGAKEKTPEGHLIAWGYLQCVDTPYTSDPEGSLERVNNLLYQQNSISRSLLSFLKTDNTNEVIEKILRDILLQFKGSRVYIIEYDQQHHIQSCVYEVVAKGVEPQQENLSHFSIESTPWWTEQITNYSPILLYSLDELPAEALSEKEILAAQSIKSLMVVPMIAKDHVWGYLGIDVVDKHRIWNNEDYQWFSALGNIISICMELRKSEYKAQKEQEYFRNLYQHMPIGYVRMRLLRDQAGELTNYRFVDLNPAFEKIIERPLHYYLYKTAQEIPLQVDLLEQLQAFAKIQANGSFQQYNFYSRQADKHLRCILYAPEPDEVVILFSDITETLKAHDALDKSEKTLRNIYQNIPVGIEIYDKYGYLQDMNDKNAEIFGLQDKSWGIGINIFDNPNIPDNIKQQIREQKNVDFELKYDFSCVNEYYRSHEKGIKDLVIKLTTLYNSDNELESYMLILIDNTETSTAHSKIQEFENFFSAIADFAKIGYFKWNLCTQTGFAINQWYKNWGESESTPLQEIVGQYPNLHPDDRDNVMNFYENLEKGIVTNLKTEVRVGNEEEGWRWIRCNITVKEYDPEHHNIELIGINFDITELKEIEAKLLEAKNKAETLDKLKSAFLANMSHEIRTPLNAIVGFSNLLVETETLDERQQYMAIIQENNELLLQLISDILDLSKIEAGTFEISYGDVDVNQLCQETVRSLSLKTATGVTLEFEHFEPSCHLWGDRNRLTQVINNFINNALKFTTQGYIRLGYHLQKDKIEFYVSDTGIGISKDHLPTIFDRFVKLNSFIHGTGLGLSICKSIIEQMGGKIGVESELGKGSRFWFSLPYIPPQAKIKQAFRKPAAKEISGGLIHLPTVLVAEDTESNFILISTVLKKEYHILWAQNGREALELYREQKPDLILMDIRMPQMDGLTATRHIRETDKEVPIIALTAFAFDSDRIRALEAGCNEYMSKPIQPKALKEAIRQLLP